MMPINPILAAAAADMLVGYLYYSDYMCGHIWKKATGLKCDMSKDFYLRVATQAVASVMIATALYIAILTFKKTELPYAQEMYTRIYSWFFKDVNMVQADMMSSMKIAGFMWLGFVFPMTISHTVWHTTINWQKAAIKLGGKLLQFLAMAAVFAYLG